MARTKITAKKKVTAKKGAVKKPAPKKGNEALIEKLTHFVRSRADSYLSDPNITSIGIGYKQKNGRETKQLAIRFSVRSKVAPQDLSSLGTRPIPPTLKVAGVTIPTDVLERSFKPSFTRVRVVAKDERRIRANTLRPGMSVGSIHTAAGTLGTFVLDRQSRKAVMLSNWHVLHGPQGELGNDIVQPGKFDDNRVGKNFAGRLLRSHLGPAGDCAIASVVGRQYSNDIVDLATSVRQVGEPKLGDRVVKSSRTTGVTYGVVTEIQKNTSMTYPGGITETIGGFEIGPDPKRRAANNEISKSGDSGAAWMAVGRNSKPSNVMLGLHFAGDADDDGSSSETALACYAKSVMTKLEVEPLGEVLPQAIAANEEDGLPLGFDRDFLKFSVDAPRFTATRRADLASLEGDNELRYCHFSVWLSQTRKYPLCVAWNIDGAQFKRVKRTNFRTDRRGDLEEYQLTDDIYYKNVLDKGHIARRADLCWGTLAEARQANYDSSYYTNIAPQHEAFNQSDDTSFDSDGGIWGRLENTILDSERPHRLQISLLAGPVFSTKDRKFSQNGEQTYLPREYWKVVAYTDDQDSKEKVYGFLLTQAKLIEGLVSAQGLNFDDWLWARITLRDLQNKTGVTFPKALKDREISFAKPQMLGTTLTVKPLFQPSEYFAD